MSQFNRITNTDTPSSAGRNIPFMAPMWGSDNSQVVSLNQEQLLMPYQSISDQPIPQFQNGRVTGVMSERANPFDMFTENNNSSNNTKETILYGTFVRTILSDTFFSEKNMDNIQDMIRYRVYISSGGEYKIGKQSNVELTIIMRSIFLMHSKNLPDHINEQINELNTKVVDYILPNIISEIKQWMHYTADLEHLPMPLEHPRNLSNKGTRTLSSTVGSL